MKLDLRQSRERERRRQQILSAAKRVCISKGFARSKITDIAREAELSVGTLYNYFNNKDELFAALSIRVLKHLNVSLWRAKERQNLSFVTQDLQQKIIGLLHQSFEIISQLFRERLEERPCHPASPSRLALALWALFSGLVLWEESKRSLDPRKDFLKPTMDVAFEIFARGIAELRGQRSLDPVSYHNGFTTLK